MRRAAALSVLAVLAACGMPEDNPTRITGGHPEILLQDGWSCYEGRCIDYHEDLQKVSVTGRERADIPNHVEIVDGYVDEWNFLRLFYAAQSADWLGAP